MFGFSFVSAKEKKTIAAAITGNHFFISHLL
jgi:hypothetical protein